MIAIIDYGSSNLFSVVKAFERAGAKKVLLTNNPNDLKYASHIVLPGQGAFVDGIRTLRQKHLVDAIYESVKEKGKPFLGICLGMQLLAETGFEHGKTEGLGLVRGKTVLLETKQKIPHIGWDTIEATRQSKLLDGLPPNPDLYFVHSYYLMPEDKTATVAICNYGQTFPAVIEQKNIYATLFHPEKSQKNGAVILHNFLKL